mmetsp:Transcript_6158/g.18148  ORF Transcript_6158/g.18148 Transcript_6158/m.18148 type:complete len:244 (+) Transcript_6158:427-1158(+)
MDLRLDLDAALLGLRALRGRLPGRPDDEPGSRHAGAAAAAGPAAPVRRHVRAAVRRRGADLRDARRLPPDRERHAAERGPGLPRAARRHGRERQHRANLRRLEGLPPVHGRAPAERCGPRRGEPGRRWPHAAHGGEWCRSQGHCSGHPALQLDDRPDRRLRQHSAALRRVPRTPPRGDRAAQELAAARHQEQLRAYGRELRAVEQAQGHLGPAQPRADEEGEGAEREGAGEGEGAEGFGWPRE